MKKIFFLPIIAVIFAGCLAKQATPYTYYEMSYNQKKCVVSKPKKKNIYIDNVSATNLVDSRNILIVDYKKRIRYANNAKFVTMPSEMVYKALIDAVFSQCGFNPIFMPKEQDLRLTTNIMALQVNEDQAVFTIAYELFTGLESKKSGIITKNVYVKDPSSQTIFNAMNKAMNLAIDEIMKEII